MMGRQQKVTLSYSAAEAAVTMVTEILRLAHMRAITREEQMLKKFALNPAFIQISATLLLKPLETLIGTLRKSEMGIEAQSGESQGLFR